MEKIISGNIKLRRFELSDIVQLARLCNNKKIWDNLRDFIPYPYTEQDAEDFIAFCNTENPQVTFAIEKNGLLVGTIGLVLQSDIHRLNAEIGYWIGEPFWGQGIATNAVVLITEYAFNVIGLIRIYSGVFDFNIASRRVLEKAGYNLDFIAEKGYIKNGKVGSEYRFSILNHSTSGEIFSQD